MKRFLSACVLLYSVSTGQAEPVWTEGFENVFPPAGWVTNSIDQSTTYAFSGNCSAKFSANSDYLITPSVSNAPTLIFWTYTTAADPSIVVEYSESLNGPWTEADESPFSGYTEQWNGQWITVHSTNSIRFRFQKHGSGTLYIDDISIENGIAATHQPPVLNPIGDKTALEGMPLSFAVTASDPIDNDPIILSATHLPTGAFFTNSVFTWSPAAPAGIYAVTFYATDKDGSGSETVSLTVAARPNLLISEIADPSGTGGDAYRFIELYNAGANAVDLAADGWTLSKQVNGGTWYDIPLTGTVAAAATYLAAYSAPDFQTAYGFSPDQESGSVSGNGDDVYALYYAGTHTNGVLIDLYGEFDADGTDTAWDYEDSRAVRNNPILQPNPVWTASEWTIFTGASPEDMTPGIHGPLPVFKEWENPFIFPGDNLNLPVTAVNPVRTDVITLSAASLPAGAVFSATTGTNRVSSMLNWNNPTAGVYTATFAAAGTAGTNTASITITVSKTSRIDGKFYGWSGDTLFKLSNGQFWQQVISESKTVPVMIRPVVTITNVYGQHKMSVANVTGSVAVTPLDVTESAIPNRFTGLYYENLYPLADGSVWKQISFENIPSSADPVTVWRWMKNGRQILRFIDCDNLVIGTCIAEASEAPTHAPIVSEIAGWFRGWQSKRVFALANGQVWQQTSLDNSTETSYRPSVTVSNWLQTGRWRMSLEGARGSISVQQLTNVVRTAIAGHFYGFGNRRIFHLADGSWRRQTSPDSSTSTRLNPEILIWSENGTDYLEMPDEGLRISAEKLNMHLESTVISVFTGLHYGNLYRLANGENWLQLSFENVSAIIDNPNVMLWSSGTQTHMVVRDSRDVMIGTCIVADPALDSDSDGVNNAKEVMAGFDPLNKQSRFDLRQTDRCILSWDAIEDRIYTIEWAPSLTAPFQTLENSIVWPQNSWTDTVHTVETKGFYRILVRLTE